jgi:hypothetical protein
VFAGRSIEWITHDFNNDGWLDIMGGGSILMNNGDMTFTPLPGVMRLPENGPVGDLNNDGSLDIANHDQLFLNRGNGNHWLTVNTVGTVSNSNGIGARVEVVTVLGPQIRDVRSGDGFRHMSTLNTHFGLGADEVVTSLTVRWPSGIVDVLNDLPADTVITVVEGLYTSVAETPGQELEIFPNPVSDRLSIRGGEHLGTRPARILDAAGKEVWRGVLRNGTLDVSKLTTGLYLLRLDDGTPLQSRFLKG